ncbi:MAG TPA: c-type cytochrome biogenesis protein CcsB, partial [Microbacteriaceae bacterium]|nr:c-type cytochrome biogenesis protein CcsB [Microbacteriaceae bacterium]
METLENYSNIALYSAVVVYAIAFIFYAVDLANRSAAQTQESASSKSVKIAFSMTVLGFILHVGATALRGIAAG